MPQAELHGFLQLPDHTLATTLFAILVKSELSVGGHAGMKLQVDVLQDI